eukprot:CAMPEP_0176042016 /NCGR_PEP_ID=MMETSP0120_2-20121206/20847_1 /TAXON_ID=160619 /ORGANISM="Kryptoperidinium foliaceum, Strain CCMP 1326" /LENGTH=518 /DNA_ID=CAMNT_0017375427 /DNA_START=74 /DNA_END=1630 /DNA_ORIENTATION=+
MWHRRPWSVVVAPLLWAFSGMAQTVEEMEYPWYLVDTTAVLCKLSDPPAPGVAQLSIDIDALVPADKQTSPHIFTFFRTTNRSVEVTFKVTDASSKVVVPSTTVKLQDLARRRLGAAVEDPEPDDEELQAWIDSLPSDDFASARRLAARRRGASATTTVPRRRRTASSSSSSSSTSSASTPRRRANPAVARRRGSPATNTQQPMTGVGGSRYTNSQGMAYGYTNPTRLNSNYAGGYKPTGYGYSGANAYQRPTPSGGSMMGKLALAAGAGVVVGLGASYLYSRWDSYPSCTSDSDDNWSGSCSSCRSRFGRTKCQPETPTRASRDDLMDTGFWPDDYTSPLLVEITGISGADFSPSAICPPVQDWNETLNSDLFLTLTQISELGDKLEEDSETGLGSIIGSIFGSLMFCFCCVGLPAFICYRIFKRGSRDNEMHTQQVPVCMGQPMQQQGIPMGMPMQQQGIPMGTPMQQQGIPMGSPMEQPGGYQPGGFQPGYQPGPQGYQPGMPYQPGIPVQGGFK